MMNGLRLLTIVPFALLVAAGFAGCGPAPSNSPNRDSAPAPAQSKATDTTVAPAGSPAQPKPAGDASALTGVELVRNGDFDAWAKGLPAYWRAAEPKAVALDRAKGNDTRCLEISPIENDWASVWQALKADARAKGKTLEVSARVRGTYPNNTRLRVRYKAGGQGHVEQSLYTAQGQEWQTVTVRAALPADYDPNSLVVEIGVRPGGKAGSHVDDVSAKIQ